MASTWPVLISKHTCIHTVHAVILDLSLHTNQVAHQARAYPSLSSMKWVGGFLLAPPPSWMGCYSITGLSPSPGVERTNHEANSIICNSKRIKIKWILSYTVYMCCLQWLWLQDLWQILWLTNWNIMSQKKTVTELNTIIIILSSRCTSIVQQWLLS